MESQCLMEKEQLCLSYILFLSQAINQVKNSHNNIHKKANQWSLKSIPIFILQTRDIQLVTPKD